MKTQTLKIDRATRMLNPQFLVIILLLSFIKIPSQFILKSKESFTPLNKTVLIFDNGKSKVTLFKSSLEVNTDGTPLSYNSDDLRGKTKGLNNICNGVTVKRKGEKTNLCYKNYTEAINAFGRFRDNNYAPIEGYDIYWQSVLHVDPTTKKPCVIQKGEFKGYFSSDTSLKNGLEVSARGECEYKNQVSSMEVDGLVLPGGKNVFSNNGVKIGDLAFCLDMENKKFYYAIIYDGGPEKKVGEGSISLNAKIKGKNLPKNYQEVKQLAVSKNLMIGFIPASKSTEFLPHTNENTQIRVEKWLLENGYTTETFINFLQSQVQNF